MDAKPHRPRTFRVNDENMAPMSVNPNGKSLLLGRTKSSPSLSSLLHNGTAKAAAAANKRILGEVTVNGKLAKPLVNDDSEIGKVSPFKAQQPDTAILARPAARPLAPKQAGPNAPIGGSSATTYVASKASSTDQVPVAQPEQALKVAPKKSIKVFQGHQDVAAPQHAAPPASHQDPHPLPMAAPRQTAYPHQTVFHQPAAQVQLAPHQAIPQQSVVPTASAHMPAQEVRRTDMVPLHGEPHFKPVGAIVPDRHYTAMPHSFASEQEYHAYLQQNAQVHHHYTGGNVQHLPTPQSEHCGDDDGLQYVHDGYTTAHSLALSFAGYTTIMNPGRDEVIAKELAAAKMFVDSSRTQEDIQDDMYDTSMVEEYSEDIFGYFRELEVRMAPNPEYMDQQTEIQWSMRGVLMDWVIQVHQRFNLLPETLFLAANYIDRFLSAKVVSLGKLQLVGATAIFVAAKYEEVQCPTINEIIYMVDGGYTTDELLKAERFMLSMLKYELGWPGPMSFLRRISKADDYDLETRTLAKYFLEITLMDERFLGCTPSYLAAGAHCLARLMLGKGDWTEGHVHYSQFTFAQLAKLLVGIMDCCEDPERHHRAVFDKYTDKRYKRASTFVRAEIEKGFELPFNVGDITW